MVAIGGQRRRLVTNSSEQAEARQLRFVELAQASDKDHGNRKVLTRTKLI